MLGKTILILLISFSIWASSKIIPGLITAVETTINNTSWPQGDRCYDPDRDEC